MKIRNILGVSCVWIGVSFIVPHAARAGVDASTYDFIVAQDGSGSFTTVQGAFNAAKFASARNARAPQRIFVKAGVYHEKLHLKTNRVTLVGEDPLTTILTYDDYIGKPDGTDDGINGDAVTSTYLSGDDFTARNITFANASTASAQAIALWVGGKRNRFFDCRFLGAQDTLYTTGRKQYFKRCYIEGTIDFIFGTSTAVFDRCTIFCKAGGFMTAAATTAQQTYGYVFKRCVITGTAPDSSVYLGRPWGDNARVVLLHCKLDRLIAPEGWDDWGDSDDRATAYFAEYNCTGEGADPSERVDWSHQLTDGEAAGYSLKKIFGIADSAGAQVLATAAPWYVDTGL